MKTLIIVFLLLAGCARKPCPVNPPVSGMVFTPFGGPGNPERMWSVCSMKGTVETCANQALLWDEAQTVIEHMKKELPGVEFYPQLGTMQPAERQPDIRTISPLGLSGRARSTSR